MPAPKKPAAPRTTHKVKSKPTSYHHGNLREARFAERCGVMILAMYRPSDEDSLEGEIPDRELRSAALAMGWPTMDLTSPVRLRDRLPDVPTPSRTVLAGAGVAVVGVATALWWTRSLRTRGADRA